MCLSFRLEDVFVLSNSLYKIREKIEGKKHTHRKLTLESDKNLTMSMENMASLVAS